MIEPPVTLQTISYWKSVVFSLERWIQDVHLKQHKKNSENISKLRYTRFEQPVFYLQSQMNWWTVINRDRQANGQRDRYWQTVGKCYKQDKLTDW